VSTVRFAPISGLRGAITVPSDKSITHRAILFGALSDGVVRVVNPLDSEDTAATLGAMEASGVQVEGDLGHELTIHGVGLRGLRPPERIDCMNAGTLMRLVVGIMVGQEAQTELDGDASLRRRPMNRVARPLAAMGAQVVTAPGGTPPVTIMGGAPLTGMRHDLQVASGQVKSCLLLAGLFAGGETWVSEPEHSRDHTERMLEAAGVEILRDGLAVGVRGPVSGLNLPSLTVPGDFSSAAFHCVAATLLADPQVRLNGVNLNPTRTGLLTVLQRMGADIEVQELPAAAGEPYGNLVISRATQLRGTVVEAHEVPSLIDEVMLVALLGAFADGTTTVRGAAELRVKESDRIRATCTALQSIGVRIDEHDDGFTVHGGGIRGGSISAGGDHRMAMLGAVAGLASSEGVAVEGFEVAAVSYPGFARDLADLGAA
jgi:3-phosphoshikimate 1-carboxyvinyltransferase